MPPVIRRADTQIVNRSRNKLVSVVINAAAILLSVAMPGAALQAHEIPTDVVVQTIVKPEGKTLNLLVRVPLEAMRDVNFPETGPGYLVISAADQAIRDAATIWIAQEVSIFENERLLDTWDIVAARLSLPSDRAFEQYESAYAGVMRAPLSDSEDLQRDQALLDVLIRYPVDSASSDFSISPQFARLGGNLHHHRGALSPR